MLANPGLGVSQSWLPALALLSERPCAVRAAHRRGGAARAGGAGGGGGSGGAAAGERVMM
eukprot:COSAG01_NODE_6905_length_3444_cov_19.912108_1_plen_59_part_10